MISALHRATQRNLPITVAAAGLPQIPRLTGRLSSCSGRPPRRAGRYDGMDFPGDTCRVEVVPEVPVATSDLEEFVSAYLRDAPFAEARFSQRVAQALGRCNRGEHDRAVYLLTDPEFLGRFSQRRTLDALPDDVRADVYAALDRSDRGFASGLAEAERFLAGEPVEPTQ